MKPAIGAGVMRTPSFRDAILQSGEVWDHPREAQDCRRNVDSSSDNYGEARLPPKCPTDQRAIGRKLKQCDHNRRRSNGVSGKQTGQHWCREHQSSRDIIAVARTGGNNRSYQSQNGHRNAQGQANQRTSKAIRRCEHLDALNLHSPMPAQRSTLTSQTCLAYSSSAAASRSRMDWR